MSDITKIALVLVTFMAGFAAVLVVGGIRWLQDAGDDLRSEGAAVTAEAQDYAQDGTNQACLDEALLRGSQCDGMVCEVKTNQFLATCLAESRPSPGFCADVPDQGQMRATVAWALGECSDVGFTDRSCTRLMQRVQEFCTAP